VVFGFAMFAMSLVLPQLMQLPQATGFGLGETMLTVGLVMAPSGLVMMAMAPLSARITASRGPKVTLMVAAVVVAVGYVLAILLMAQLWHFVLVSVVIGAGIGLGYGAMPALIMGAVPRSETASANSLNTLMRSIGTSVASAVAGVVLAHMTAPLGAVALPTQAGFRTVLAIGAGAAVVAFAVAALIPARRVAAAVAATVATVAAVGRTISGRVAPGTVTVTAYDGGGAAVASTRAEGGRYRLEGLPAEPLTLVAVEHPQVRAVTLTGGAEARLDLPLGPAPAPDPAPEPALRAVPEGDRA
jgi:MFS family permease